MEFQDSAGAAHKAATRAHGNSRENGKWDAPPVMKWPRHPNLRRRPHSPNKGRGRLQLQVRRAFAVCGPVVSSSQVYDWCFAHKRKVSQLRRYGVWRILQAVAEPVGRAETIGRPWLWRLRNSEDI